jgi:hypothetical protein
MRGNLGIVVVEVVDWSRYSRWSHNNHWWRLCYNNHWWRLCYNNHWWSRCNNGNDRRRKLAHAADNRERLHEQSSHATTSAAIVVVEVVSLLASVVVVEVVSLLASVVVVEVVLGESEALQSEAFSVARNQTVVVVDEHAAKAATIVVVERLLKMAKIYP